MAQKYGSNKRDTAGVIQQGSRDVFQAKLAQIAQMNQMGEQARGAASEIVGRRDAKAESAMNRQTQIESTSAQLEQRKNENAAGAVQREGEFQRDLEQRKAEHEGRLAKAGVSYDPGQKAYTQTPEAAQDRELKAQSQGFTTKGGTLQRDPESIPARQLRSQEQDRESQRNIARMNARSQAQDRVIRGEQNRIDADRDLKQTYQKDVNKDWDRRLEIMEKMQFSPENKAMYEKELQRIDARTMMLGTELAAETGDFSLIPYDTDEYRQLTNIYVPLATAQIASDPGMKAKLLMAGPEAAARERNSRAAGMLLAFRNNPDAAAVMLNSYQQQGAQPQQGGAGGSPGAGRHTLPGTPGGQPPGGGGPPGAGGGAGSQQRPPGGAGGGGAGQQSGGYGPGKAWGSPSGSR